MSRLQPQVACRGVHPEGQLTRAHAALQELPRVTGGASVAVSNPENAAVSETDVTSDSKTYTVSEIAGLQDMSRQVFERSLPGMDYVLFADLRAAYNAKLSDALYNGSGSN